jgi:hypothetical protein
MMIFVMPIFVIMSVVMLSVVMLSVVMLSVVMLSVVMLSVVMLSVVMLSVVAPPHKLNTCAGPSDKLKKTFSSSSLTARNNKLECLSQASFFRPV